MIATVVLGGERFGVDGGEVECTPCEINDAVVVVRSAKGAVPHVARVS